MLRRLRYSPDLHDGDDGTISHHELIPRSRGLFYPRNTTADEKKKANRGPRLTPEGLRPQHPRRG
jgi:hypothetical protein